MSTQVLGRSEATSLPLVGSRGTLVSGRWLLRLRWVVGGSAVLAGALTQVSGTVGFPAALLLATGAAILGYNALLQWWGHRIEEPAGGSAGAHTWLARTQVGLDLLAVMLLVHATGGIESPLLLLFSLYVVVARLLLAGPEALVAFFSAVGALTALATGEAVGLIPHLHLSGFFPGESAGRPVFVACALAVAAIAGLVGFWLTAEVARGVRRSEDQLGALYLASQAVASTLELSEVLDRLMRETVEVMGASGASIGLLDRTGTQIEPASSYGLSERYLAKGPVYLLPSYIQSEVMTSGEPTFIDTDDDRDRLQYPDVAKAEGINTILYVRLPGKTRPLGLMRAYSNRRHAFSGDDARFLATIAAQGASAIENALAFQTLRQLDAEKSKFVRVVTHELRAPVRCAQTIVMAMLDGYAGALSPKQLDFTTRVERRLATLQLLVDDLLQLAAGRSGFDLDEPRRLPIADAVRHAVGQVEPQAQAKRQRLELRCEPALDALEVQCTRTGLSRVLANLLGNAVKYTREGGEVTVSVRRTGRNVDVEVRDTGIGIPRDSLARLFTEFYRAPNAKAFETGTGLGLVIVKELVERFEGTLAVHSVEGEGSSFTVGLPVAST